MHNAWRNDGTVVCTTHLSMLSSLLYGVRDYDPEFQVSSQTAV
jgi:hypothetical protein